MGMWFFSCTCHSCNVAQCQTSGTIHLIWRTESKTYDDESWNLSTEFTLNFIFEIFVLCCSTHVSASPVKFSQSRSNLYKIYYVKRSMPICLSTAHWKVRDSSKRFELMLFFSGTTTEEEHKLETFGRIPNFSVCCAKANGHGPFYIIPQYFSALRQLALVVQ